MHASQRVHDVKMASYWRRCDVITSHRRQYDVITTSCSCWVRETYIKVIYVVYISSSRQTMHQSWKSDSKKSFEQGNKREKYINHYYSNTDSAKKRAGPCWKIAYLPCAIQCTNHQNADPTRYLTIFAFHSVPQKREKLEALEVWSVRLVIETLLPVDIFSHAVLWSAVWAFIFA